MENKSLVVKTVFNPDRDTAKAKRAADKLIDIVKQNNWAINLGGKKDHLMYEAWQTVGKYFNVTVATKDAESVEIAGVVGFKAIGYVIDNKTGMEVGHAEAYCMRDENNWKTKPTFQLASMAQTRAGAKALRQMFGFVVALAGYSPTPAEEMTGEEHTGASAPILASDKQIEFIRKLLAEKGGSEKTVKIRYGVEIEKLNKEQASQIIENLIKLPAKILNEVNASLASNVVEGEEINNDEVEAGIEAMEKEKQNE